MNQTSSTKSSKKVALYFPTARNNSIERVKGLDEYVKIVENEGLIVQDIIGCRKPDRIYIYVSATNHELEPRNYVEKKSVFAYSENAMYVSMEDSITASRIMGSVITKVLKNNIILKIFTYDIVYNF